MRTTRRSFMARGSIAALTVFVARGARGQTHPQPAGSASQARVMVLGVYHFGNPNQDYVKTDVDDHLAERRQREIAGVTDALAAWRPTKIAVEAVDGASPVHERYAAWLRSEYVLSASERDQLGFRLARRLGHPRIYAIDHELDMDVERVVKAAQASGNAAFLAQFQAAIAEVQAFMARQPTMSVAETLRAMNEPGRIARERNLYLQMARVRSEAGWDGADVLAAWYQRNFRIYANLARITEPGDRVLVIFGAGHSAILRDLVSSGPDMVLVEPNEYLPGK